MAGIGCGLAKVSGSACPLKSPAKPGTASDWWMVRMWWFISAPPILWGGADIEGQAYEGHNVLPLLGGPAGLCVVGDKGFDSDKLRQQLQMLGATHCIPRWARCGIQRKVSRKLYRQRYRIENYFGRLKRWACASTRRDKLAMHFLSLIEFASLIDWLQYGR